MLVVGFGYAIATLGDAYCLVTVRTKQKLLFFVQSFTVNQSAFVCTDPQTVPDLRDVPGQGPVRVRQRRDEERARAGGGHAGSHGSGKANHAESVRRRRRGTRHRRRRY